MGGQKGIACFYEAFSTLLPVTLVSTKNNEYPKELAAEFLPILSNHFSRYFNVFLLIRLSKIINKRKSTHIILEHPYLGWMGIILQLFLKVKVIIHSHNIESLRFKSTGKWWWRILWFYEKTVHRNADINFFITEEDRVFAINNFKLDQTKCFTITYGFDLNTPPSNEERKMANNKLKTLHHIPSDIVVLLFNGTLDYKPNLDAVNHIINNINPILQTHTDFKYNIIICGKGLPASYNNLQGHKNIIYAGFVDDISLYFKGADIFINPVIDGGGIKTKLVEALGNNLFTISTIEGAIGVPEEITNKRMHIVKSNDWNLFADAIVHASYGDSSIDQAFFDYFYWDKIAKKAANAIGNK